MCYHITFQQYPPHQTLSRMKEAYSQKRMTNTNYPHIAQTTTIVHVTVYKIMLCTFCLFSPPFSTGGAHGVMMSSHGDVEGSFDHGRGLGLVISTRPHRSRRCGLGLAEPALVGDKGGSSGTGDDFLDPLVFY